MRATHWRRPALWLSILAVVAAWDASAASKGSQVSNSVQNRYYVLFADMAKWVPTGSSAAVGSAITGRLKLTGVHDEVDWYADRPEHDAGTLSANEFFESVWPEAFAGTAPNAVVNATFPGDGSDQVHGLFVTLDRAPRFQAARKGGGTARFPSIEVRSWTLLDDPLRPLTLERVRITVLHNTGPTEPNRWSFSHVGTTARFQTRSGGGYTLTLHDVVGNPRELSHAPSRGLRERDLLGFVADWEERFGDDPPSASLTSHVLQGGMGRPDLEAQLLELSFPEAVEHADGQIDLVYEADLLHGEIDEATVYQAPALLIDSVSRRALTFVNNCDFPVWIGFTGSESANEACTPTAVPKDCPSAKTCSATTHKCLCGADSDCPGTQSCLLPDGICTCASNADCPTAQACNLAADPHTCYWALPTPAAREEWELKSGGTTTFTIPIDSASTAKQIVFSGAVFGRTACNDGYFCETADCGSNPCASWVGPDTPHSRAEFTFQNSVDFYNTSLIHGFNVPLVMEPDRAGLYRTHEASDPKFGCGDPGSTSPSLAAWAPFGCDYGFRPVSDSFRFVTDGGDPCSSRCMDPHDVCGLSLRAIETNSDTTTCGRPLGYWSADQVCVFNESYSRPPFECTRPEPHYGTFAKLYACHPDGGDTCYAANAPANCCGCIDWEFPAGDPIPASGQCENDLSSPNSWRINAYADKLPFLKEACPMAYAYPFDDKSSTFTCATDNVTDPGATDRKNDTDYTFTFCPSDGRDFVSGGVDPPPNTLGCTQHARWTVATAPTNGLELYDVTAGGRTLLDEAAPLLDSGVAVSFSPVSGDSYLAEVTLGAPPMAVAQCHLLFSDSTGCLLIDPQPADLCEGWTTQQKDGTLSIGRY